MSSSTRRHTEPRRHSRFRHRRLVLLAGGVLLLVACGDDQAANDDPAAVADDAQEASGSETDTADPEPDPAAAPEPDATEEGDDATEDADATLPFDPDQAVPMKEWVFEDWDGTERAVFTNLFVPDDLPWPVTMQFIQTATDTSEATEPVLSSNGSFNVRDPDANVDVVMGFFEDRLPALGWDMDEVRDNGDDSRWIQWLIRQPHENPERSYEVELRVEYLAPFHSVFESDYGTLRWWTATREVFQAYDG